MPRTTPRSGPDVERGPDDVDRLLERGSALTGLAPRPAHPGDRVPEVAGADPELEPAAAHHVERCGCLREHRRRPHRQARDVGEEAQPGRASEQVRDEGERVEEAPLVRVILDADEVEPGALRGEHLLDDLRVGLGVGRHRDPEGWRPACQWHSGYDRFGASSPRSYASATAAARSPTPSFS